MFIPIHDDNPLKVISFQRVTVGLIIANVLTFLWQTSLAPGEMIAADQAFGVVPAALVGGLPDFGAFPEELALLTYMFLHADVWHLAGNMLFLWVLGDNVEDDLGHLRYLAFYLLCGVAAALLFSVPKPDSTVPLIGASGATSGLVAAYLMLHPRVRMWAVFVMRIPLYVPAWGVLGGWVAFQVVMVVADPGSPTAWWGHIGGFLAGVVLTPLLKRPGVPLFGRAPIRRMQDPAPR